MPLEVIKIAVYRTPGMHINTQILPDSYVVYAGSSVWPVNATQFEHTYSGQVSGFGSRYPLNGEQAGGYETPREPGVPFEFTVTAYNAAGDVVGTYQQIIT